VIFLCGVGLIEWVKHKYRDGNSKSPGNDDEIQLLPKGESIGDDSNEH
jgi:hypothetical protein